MAVVGCQFSWSLLLACSATAACNSFQRLADQEPTPSSSCSSSSFCKQAPVQPIGVEAEEVAMVQVSLDPEFQRARRPDTRQQPLPNFGMAEDNRSGAYHMYSSLIEESAALWDKFMVVTQVVSSAATPASAVLAGEQRGVQHLLGRSSQSKPQFKPLPPLRLEQEGSAQPNRALQDQEVPARTGMFAQLQPQMLVEQKERSNQTSQMQSLTVINYAIILLVCGAGVAFATLYLFARMREQGHQPHLSFSDIPNPFATQEAEPPKPTMMEPRQKKKGCC